METNSTAYTCRYRWDNPLSSANQNRLVSLVIGQNGVTLFAYDIDAELPLTLRHYTLPDYFDDFSGLFKHLIDALQHIDSTLTIHQLIVDRSDYTIIPNAYLTNITADDHLAFLFGSNNSHLVKQVRISDNDEASLVYRYPQSLQEAISHYSINLIGHADQWLLQRSLQKNGLHCFIDPARIKVHLIKNNSLHYTGTETYTNQQDVLFYLMTICKQYAVDPKEVTVILNGFISPTSALYQTLHDYFLTIQWADTDGLHAESDNLPTYFYSALKHVTTCAS